MDLFSCCKVFHQALCRNKIPYFPSPGIIDRNDEEERGPRSPLPIDKPFEVIQKEFELADVCDFARCAMEVSASNCVGLDF